MERSQFTFYDSFFKAISRIKSKASRCDAYDALCAYALQGIEPDIDNLPDAAAIAFELVKPNLDAGRRKALSGSKGGSKESVSKTEANDKQTESKGEANDKQTESKNKNKDKKKNKNKIKDKCLTREDFDLFWDLYPRKVGKPKAMEAFMRLDVDLETILEAVRKQSTSQEWTKDNGQFIPHPTTWLNRKGWEDELTYSARNWPGARGELGEAELEAIARVMEG